jgi:hypothetical protein
MPREDTGTFVASFQNHNLGTWETEIGHLWKVTNSVTGGSCALFAGNVICPACNPERRRDI